MVVLGSDADVRSRRCVAALRLARGNYSRDGICAKPGEDDWMMVAASNRGMVKSRLSDVLEQLNSRIRI
jgi:hypothetical protein